ncbi:hypothetical protein BDV96DRAFT_693181 [Lophiotrema nucula]|uniref:Fungal STAND N-terminal Goodbye domain-containing protein n=1 Tax=Lophiotrema nucula TaxID=690887 RepID=A0A6A5YL50_9PLEO|nr:hypothetical protein BDV96DRAFT_693181 [Lophiotrema nucula]
MTLAMEPDFSPTPLKHRNTFYGGKDDPTLQAARDASSSQHSFWKRIRKDLTKSDIKRVDAVVQSYEDKHTIEGLESLLGEYLPATEDEVSKLYDRRNQGGKAVSAEIQKFCKTFGDFLNCYSQVIELVKSADNQLGGVAVQTLSLFLIIAVNKSAKEELIESALLKIKHNFPRLKDLRTWYPTKKMQELIAQVYKSVLAFLQKAIDYYKRSAWTRVWKAVSEPPQLGVQLAVDRILDELAEVREERDTLLSGRIHKLERTMGEVSNKLDGQQHMLQAEQLQRNKMQEELHNVQSSATATAKDVGQIKRNQSEDLLSNLQERLNPDQFDCDDHLTEYRSQLKYTFRKRAAIFGLDQISSHEAYQKWETSKGSSTLVLRGRTTTRTALSWLSQAAVELIDELKQDRHEDKDTAVVYHFCKREGMPEDDHMHTTITRLLHQLLKLRPSILHNRSTYASFSDKLEDPSWQKRQVKEASSLFAAALKEFRTAYIIIDRPEMCTGGSNGLAKLLEKVADEIEGECRVRFLLIVDKDECDEADLDDWKEKVGDGAFAVIDDLDQR